MTISDALKYGDEAMIFLSHILGKDKAWILANQDRNLTTKRFNKFKKLIEKRRQGWPVAYLTGIKEFYGLAFKVTPAVLIPRPESELLVELALNRIKNHESRIMNVVDVGTGSGNIIISIAKSLENGEYHRVLYDTPKLVAIDSSTRALNLAKGNGKRHGVSDKIKLLRGNLLNPILQATRPTGLEATQGGRASYKLKATLIVANLPYLTNKQLNPERLRRAVGAYGAGNLTIKHEPQEALYGGPDGLKYFRELFKQMDSRLRGNDEFVLLLEHGPAQKSALNKLVKQYFPHAKIKFHKDLADNWRVLEFGLEKQPVL